MPCVAFNDYRVTTKNQESESDRLLSTLSTPATSGGSSMLTVFQTMSKLISKYPWMSLFRIPDIPVQWIVGVLGAQFRGNAISSFSDKGSRKNKFIFYGAGVLAAGEA